MKYVGTIELRDRLTIDDFDKIASITESLSKPPGNYFARRLIIWRGLNQVIRITTTSRYVFFNKKKKINEIMKLHDMQKKADTVEEKSKKPLRETINGLVTWLAVQLKQTPNRVATETPMDYVPSLYANIVKDKIEAWTMAALAHHAPEEIKKHSDKLRRSISSMIRPITGKRAPKPSGKLNLSGPATMLHFAAGMT